MRRVMMVPGHTPGFRRAAALTPLLLLLTMAAAGLVAPLPPPALSNAGAPTAMPTKDRPTRPSANSACSPMGLTGLL